VTVNDVFRWDIPPEVAFDAGVIHGLWMEVIREVAWSYAPQIETWMKRNAKWTDRTGNARQTLYTEVHEFLSEIEIEFGQGMDYGRFLELAHQGRFSVLTPALTHFAPRIYAHLRRIAR
jgi:hypothetical protein